MKIKRFTLLTLPVLAFVIGAIVLSGTSEPRYFPREINKADARLANGFLEYMEMVKANRLSGSVNPDDVFTALKQADKLPKSKASLDINWSFIGPDNIGGRTRALIIDKDDSDHLLVGGVAGGVFESFNGARSWQPYDPDFKVNNISCITQSIDGSFYVGTGGHFEGRRTGTNRGYFFVGSGVHKLTGDGNYELIVGPLSRNSVSVDYATIGEIVAAPDDANKLYVAMNNGFRILQIDPNNGSVTESDPIGLNQSCADIAISDDGKVVVTYLGQGGLSGRVYVSQGNDNFTLSNPTTNMGRIEVAIAPSNSSIMYAAVADRGSTCLRGIFRSRDSGQNWEGIAPPGTSTFDMFANFGVNCQGTWDNVIAVYPNNPGKILVGGVTLYQWNQSSVDPAPANGSWKQIDILADFNVAGDRIPNYLHADKHAIVFDPEDSDVAYFATDGGIAKSTNINDNIPSYEVSNFNYGVTQYYAIGVNNKGVVVGGTQDNGTHILNLRNSANKSGYEVIGGDGFDCHLSSIDTSIGFGSVYYNSIARIQGIGTTAANSNFSTADVTSVNPFLSGACNSGNGCSVDFYTATTFWESFNHEASSDQATVQLELKTLPPIPDSTVIPFEGNNNFPQEYIVSTNNGEGLFPIDTISGGTGALDTFEVSSLPVVHNFDTITINEQTNSIVINRRGDTASTPLTINYTVGTSQSYQNVLLGNASLVEFIVDTFSYGSNVGETFIAIERKNIVFRYNFKVQDKVQSIYVSANWPGLTLSGLNYNDKNIFMSRDMLKGTPDMKWYQIGGSNSTPDGIVGSVLDMKFSADGNYLFVGTDVGRLYRISDLNYFDTSSAVRATSNQNFDSLITSGGPLDGKCVEIGRFNNQSVTSIDVDHNNPDNVVVALGNYGNNNFVARTTVATTAIDNTTFEFIQGVGNTALPTAPAYSVLIDMNDPNRVLIGNELGVFGTDNAFVNDASLVEWSEENFGMGRVPVFDMKQIRHPYQYAKNSGKIYIGTHGRGIYTADVFVGLDKNEKVIEESKTFKNSMKMFPNPVQDIASIEFKVEDVTSPVLIEIYNIRGQKVKEEKLSRLNYGKNTRRLNFSDLNRGTYIIRAVHQSQVFSTKFIKQ